MSVKETINKHPVQTTIISAVVCLAAIGVIFWELAPKGKESTRWVSFFSDDDGQTWFLDDASKVPPFDHNGKEACGAVLFRCGGGKPFVGYLQKWRDRTATDTPPDVKAPGDKNWISGTLPGGKPNPECSRVLKPKCPDGSAGAPTRVQVYDPDIRK